MDPSISSKLFGDVKPVGFTAEWSFSLNSYTKQSTSFEAQKLYMTEEEMVLHSHSPWPYCPSLLQNCDLPPPVKVFTAADQTALNSVIPKHIIISKPNQGEGNGEVTISKKMDERDKLELMKALQHSQSRARTAEKKASLMAEEKDKISALLLSESLRLFAHRHWLKILQLEVSQLQSQKDNKNQHSPCIENKQLERDQGSSKAEDGDNVGSLALYMTSAFWLGIASVGVAVGCRYLL